MISTVDSDSARPPVSRGEETPGGGAPSPAPRGPAWCLRRGVTQKCLKKAKENSGGEAGQEVSYPTGRLGAVLGCQPCPPAIPPTPVRGTCDMDERLHPLPPPRHFHFPAQCPGAARFSHMAAVMPAGQSARLDARTLARATWAHAADSRGRGHPKGWRWAQQS